LGRLRELTLKGSLTSPTSITWKGTSYVEFNYREEKCKQ
jgi:hypothetical protein